MSLIVQKYGGSSVADLDKLRKVADKIVETAQRGHQLVVVVSAMGDTTDDLLQMAKDLCPQPPRRELDMLLSVGERISMALLSMAIHERGLEAVSLTGSQCGIITTDSHANARIIDVRPFRVQDLLAQGKIVIVAGYQGTSYKREVTTLGRGGSDTTAVALAAALDAEACEIYSDVDGVYNADPRRILDAQQLQTLSYEEMLEMARSGARVLNEQAVEFARQAKIALYARSTHNPDSRGTVIRPDGFDQLAERAERGLPAVALSHIDALLFLQSRQSADALVPKLEELPCLFVHWNPGADLQAAITLDDIHDPDALRADLQAQGEDVRCQDRGAISLIGQGIGRSPRWIASARQLLEEHQLTPQALHVQAARLSMILKTAQIDEAAALLHQHFVA